MSSIILRSRALEDHGKLNQRSFEKINRRRKVEKKTLNLRKIPETLKHKLLELKRSNILETVVEGESDKEKSRYDELLKVHEVHLKKLQCLTKKCLNLENENREINENSEQILEDDAILKRRLQGEIENSKRLDFTLCLKTNEFETELEKLKSEVDDEKTSLLQHERVFSKELADERSDRKRVENELKETQEQLETYSKDPENHDITDLGEMYIDIFDVDAEDINTYDVRLGKKTVTGVKCWFELAVKDVLSELNEKLLGLLEDDLDWFINFLFKHDLAHNLCRYLGLYHKYRNTVFKETTKYNRIAFEKAILDERLHFLTLFSSAIIKASA